VAEKYSQSGPPSVSGVTTLQGSKGGDDKSSKGIPEVLRAIAMMRRRAPPFASLPEAAISAVAFSVCDMVINMLL